MFASLMRTCEANEVENMAVSHLRPAPVQPTIKPTHLHLVTAHDLRDLSDALAKGDLVMRSIEKNCRTITALLQASQESSFREASREERERLLRVLAYVHKD